MTTATLTPFRKASQVARAVGRSRALLEELRHLEAQELATISGWDETDRLSTIRAAIDAAITVNERLEELG